MAQNSRIEWTECTWNPVTGCSKISTGCQHCYAERMALRLQAMGQPNYRNGFHVTIHQHMLDLPLRWRSPKKIFVNSMGDIFHQLVPYDFVAESFGIMTKAAQHQFQLLTKRSLRLWQLASDLPWPKNIWVGVTVETADYLERIDHLRQTGAAVKFVSFEPLLGPIPDINLEGINWVIAGGESGPGARPIEVDWVRNIREQCVEQNVPFFFKQWGGVNKKKNGRSLDGRTWNAMPQQALALR
ncbi:MAG: phage Gp37/Gp68 family protein [Planctomycetota bacterium]|nr:phage Gp37/Gp68 family protein [Planctomycetota bacterium]